MDIAYLKVSHSESVSWLALNTFDFTREGTGTSEHKKKYYYLSVPNAFDFTMEGTGTYKHKKISLYIRPNILEKNMRNWVVNNPPRNVGSDTSFFNPQKIILIKLPNLLLIELLSCSCADGSILLKSAKSAAAALAAGLSSVGLDWNGSVLSCSFSDHCYQITRIFIYIE